MDTREAAGKELTESPSYEGGQQTAVGHFLRRERLHCQSQTQFDLPLVLLYPLHRKWGFPAPHLPAGVVMLRHDGILLSCGGIASFLRPYP